jgi:hypothetical protein
MTTATIAATVHSDLDHRRQLRRAVIASTIGTTIEWYDFFLYGIATGLVFAKLYFPNSDPLVGCAAYQENRPGRQCYVGGCR